MAGLVENTQENLTVYSREDICGYIIRRCLADGGLLASPWWERKKAMFVLQGDNQGGILL